MDIKIPKFRLVKLTDNSLLVGLILRLWLGRCKNRQNMTKDNPKLQLLSMQIEYCGM